jgi:hypothetical protein
MTKEEIIEMANQVKLPNDYVGGGLMWLDKLEHFAKLVAEKEREQCAKIFDDAKGTGRIASCREAAEAIRARGQ